MLFVVDRIDKIKLCCEKTAEYCKVISKDFAVKIIINYIMSKTQVVFDIEDEEIKEAFSQDVIETHSGEVAIYPEDEVIVLGVDKALFMRMY